MLTRKPQKGDRVRWPEWRPGRTALVTATPEGADNLCWIREDGDAQAQPFIWRHPEGLNTLAEIVSAPRASTPRNP